MPYRDQVNAGAILAIDLGAIQANWRILQAKGSGATCGAVVKADAYGLGAKKVAPALWDAGCRNFFVAHVREGIKLRQVLPSEANIHVMHGPPPGAGLDCAVHDLIPVLNTPEQVAAWSKLARGLDRRLPAVLQVDTGMARLGLTAGEVDALADDPSGLAGIDLRMVMSHLVSAEVADDPINAIQLQRFKAARAKLPPCGASLANSSGVFLGADFHFDMLRPGAALYGVNPVAGAKINPMRPVVRLMAKVIQTRTVQAGVGAGYNHTWTASGPTRLATLGIGYADGFHRTHSNRGAAFLDGQRLPFVGNVSMDTTIIDISSLPEGRLREGDLVDVIGPDWGVDDVGRSIGTIGYEVLTSLGNRYARRHVPDGSGATLSVNP